MADTADQLLKSIKLTRAAIGLVSATGAVLLAVFVYAASFEKKADANRFRAETGLTLKEQQAVISTTTAATTANTAKIDDLREMMRDFHDEVRDIHREVDYVTNRSYEAARRVNPAAPAPPRHQGKE